MSLGKRFVVLMLILSLTLGGLATYFLSKNSCYRNNYIINIDKQSKQLLSQVFRTPLPTMSTRGFVVSGTNIAVHILVGDIFKYKDMISDAEKPIYGKCMPVISRYEIDPDLERFVFYEVKNNLITPDLFSTLVSPSILSSGTLNQAFLHLNDFSVLGPFLLAFYVWFPENREESDWLNGRVYFFPNEKYSNVFYGNEFVRAQDIYKYALLGFKFPVYKKKVFVSGQPLKLENGETAMALIPKKISYSEYINIVCQAYKRGLTSMLNELKSSNGVARTILLPALNTPAFPYSWSGESQALAIREMAAKQSLKISAVKHYDRLDNSPDYYHIFFVVFDQDTPSEQNAYILA